MHYCWHVQSHDSGGAELHTHIEHHLQTLKTKSKISVIQVGAKEKTKTHFIEFIKILET